MVIALRKLGTSTAEGFHVVAPLELPASTTPARVRAVVFVQDPSSRRVLGIATASLGAKH